MFYNYLNEFLIVARMLNLSRAAQALFISQPTLGKHMSALEEQMGVRLFTRTKHGLTLTESGRVLAGDGQALIAMTRELESKVIRASTASTYSLVIYNPLIQNQLLSSSLRYFHQFFPDVRMDMSLANSNQALQAVEGGKADLAFIRKYKGEEFILPANLTKCALCSDCAMFAAGFNHRLAGRKRIKLAELKNEHFIHLNYVDDITRVHLSPILTSTGSRVSDYFPINFQDVLSHLQEGRAVALLEQSMKEEVGASCAFIDITDFDTRFDIIMVYDPKNTNPALDYYLKTLPMYFPNKILL